MGNARKRLASTLVIIVSLALGACASIPPESVELSERIGAGIGKARAAHLSMLDAFYGRLKTSNDEWVLGTFLPRAIENTVARLQAACKAKGDQSPSCAQLEQGDIAELTKSTIEFRDDMQRALEKNRDEAYRIIDTHYADLVRANAGVTGLLASAVDVKSAAVDTTKSLKEITGVDIDVDAIEKAIGRFLDKAGRTGAGISDLEKDLSGALKKLEKK